MPSHSACRVHPIKALLTIFLFVIAFSFLFPSHFPSFWTSEYTPKQKYVADRVYHPHARPALIAEGSAVPPDTLHDYLTNGLLKTNMRGKHPMLELIAQGERKWEAMLNRQSNTLREAVTEYKRRYGCPPPRGFDEWYEFAVSKNFRLIDEFDQIHRDITPLSFLPYLILERRLEEVKKISEASGFVISVSGTHAANISGPALPQERSRLLHSNILAFSRWLPDIELYANGNDRSPRILSAEMRQWVAEKKGELTAADLQRMENVIRHGGDDIFSACAIAPSHDVRLDTDMAQNTAEAPMFIHDPANSSDYCQHPALAHLHGSLSIHLRARDARLFPEFVWAKMRLGGEMLLPFVEHFHAFTLTRPYPWSEKTHNKLFWRGLSTGTHHQSGHGGSLGWKGGSQRLRAAFLFSDETTSSKAQWVSNEVPLLTHTSSGPLEMKSYPRTSLNSLYTDIGLVRPPLQCEEKDGTCAEMLADVPWRSSTVMWGIERGKWKYVLDLDSNGQSGDFQKSLGLGSVVFRSTIFSQWNSDWLVPYYHYIPVKQDFADVHNAMAFFLGPPLPSKGDLGIDETRGHDHLARRIGENAERFVRELWRWEDIQVYMYRLLLEYARLVSKDRESMNYEG